MALSGLALSTLVFAAGCGSEGDDDGGSSGGTGATASGGTTGSGSTPATGGTGDPIVVGACGRTVGSCTAPEVAVTDLDLGFSVERSAGTSDTAPIPLAIAALPGGGSRLAALGSDGVHIVTLDCNDQPVGTPWVIPAVDLQDLIADDDGGVVLVTRDATDGGTDNCGSGTLCGGTSSPCRTMWMVRFDNAGAIQWETEVTNLSSAGLAGYDDGARFIWWYQHHGRLAFSGTHYAAFFGVAITVANGGCIDIHQGDRIQMVSSSGQLVEDGSLAVGMSHAWTSRILWDPRTSEFMASDATDNACRIANPYGAQTIADGDCDGTLFNGDLVLATDGGYWNAWSQGETIRLEHTSGGASDRTIDDAGSSQHPHLVSYSANHMLLTWGSGGGQTAQVRSAGDGSAIGGEFTIDVNDEPFHAYKAYADGSVAFPAVNGSSVSIARVMPCN